MGEVYLAQDTKLDRRVALKILPADVAANRDRMERSFGKPNLPFVPGVMAAPSTMLAPTIVAPA